MYSNAAVLILVVLSGGSILYDGWRLCDESGTEEAKETALVHKSPSSVFQMGKSAIDMIIEILVGLSRVICNAYSSFVDKFRSLVRGNASPTPPLSTTEKIKKKAADVTSYLKKTSTRQDLKSEFQQGLDHIWLKTTELKDLVFEMLKDNEIISVLWTMMTGEDYIIFYAGVVVPLILPQLHPFLGQLFWTLIACLQYLSGVTNSKLQRHLGWVRSEKEEEGAGGRVETAESEASVSAATLDGLSDESLRNIWNPLKETITSAVSESVAPGSYLHVAAPAKSAPEVNAENRRLPQIDAIFRNSSSETECERREKKREESRQHTRRSKMQPFGVHDIRRVAPPIDATLKVRHAIEEVERRRQIKITEAKYLDEDDDFADFQFDVEECTMPYEGVELEEVAVAAGEYRDVVENIGKTSPNGNQATCGLGDAKDTKEDKDLVATLHAQKENRNPISCDEERRERVKSRLRGVQAELQELQALSEIMTNEDLD